MLKKGWKALKKKLTPPEEHDDFCLCPPCQRERAALKELRAKRQREQMAEKYRTMLAEGRVPPGMRAAGIRRVTIRPPEGGRPCQQGRGGAPLQLTQADLMRLMALRAQLEQARGFGPPAGARQGPHAQGGAGAGAGAGATPAFGGAPSGAWGPRSASGDDSGCGRGGARLSAPGACGGGGGGRGGGGGIGGGSGGRGGRGGDGGLPGKPNWL